MDILSMNELKAQVKQKFQSKNGVIGIVIANQTSTTIQAALPSLSAYQVDADNAPFPIYWPGHSLSTPLHFDAAAFDSFIKEPVFTSNYGENVQFTLILCSVQYGNICFNDNVSIDLEEHMDTLPAVFEKSVALCTNGYSMRSVVNKMSSDCYWGRLQGLHSSYMPKTLDNSPICRCMHK